MNPLEAENYTDHDLLIVIAERTRVSGENLAKLESRVSALEQARTRAEGFLSGSKFMWALLGSAPGVAIGVLAWVR